MIYGNNNHKLRRNFLFKLHHLMKLLIAIPALNEEESIADIIERSIAARDHIISNTPLTNVDITVVSDGSTDSTVEIASKYLDSIHLIVFEKNKGYGAAIKEAWNQSDAELLSFLDADGTCDPLFFTDLCNLILETDSDIVLGSRLNKNSEMPLIRWIGNSIFAFLLSFLSSKKIKDTASGMRVVHRKSLPDIMPLPDGLHFTPAMSARAVLHEDLLIEEIDMPYREREGESKLSVWKDGIRFLKVILESSFLYRPDRILEVLSFIVLIIGVSILVLPTVHYIINGSLEEWMIYRLITGNLLGILFLILLIGAYLSKRIIRITLLKNQQPGSIETGLIYHFFSSNYPIILAIIISFLGIYLIKDSLLDRLTSGNTDEHWSRYITMSFFLSSAFLLLVSKIIDYILNLVQDRVSYLRSDLFYTYKNTSKKAKDLNL